MLTRRTFMALARAFREARTLCECDPAMIDGIATAEREVANMLALSNPTFDRERFLAACKGESK